MKRNKKVYICDPNKNKECEKTKCQRLCFNTANKEYEKLKIPGAEGQGFQ